MGKGLLKLDNNWLYFFLYISDFKNLWLYNFINPFNSNKKNPSNQFH